MILLPGRDYVVTLGLYRPVGRAELSAFLERLFSVALVEIPDSPSLAGALSIAARSVAAPSARMTASMPSAVRSQVAVAPAVAPSIKVPVAPAQAFAAVPGGAVRSTVAVAPAVAPSIAIPSAVQAAQARRITVPVSPQRIVPGGLGTGPTFTPPVGDAPPSPSPAPSVAPEDAPAAPGGGGGGGGGGAGPPDAGEPAAAPPPQEELPPYAAPQPAEVQAAYSAPAEPAAHFEAATALAPQVPAAVALSVYAQGVRVLLQVASKKLPAASTSGASDVRPRPVVMLQLVVCPRALTTLTDQPWGAWGVAAPLSVHPCEAPSLKPLSLVLETGASYDVKFLSPTMTRKAAIGFLAKAGLMGSQDRPREVFCGPMRVRSGVRMPGGGGRGLDEWIASFTWRGERGEAFSKVGPLVVEDMAPSTRRRIS